jgi:pimeloyl-ACP methyl ester carboxylesterase
MSFIHAAAGKGRGGARAWIGRLGIGSALLLFLIIWVAFTLQSVTTANALRRYPPPGELVDVGGYRLHLQSAGSGNPTVVLEAGLGGCGLAWSLVQGEVAEFTRVVSYDRAGLGWSERGPRDRTSKQLVRELDTLLRNAGIGGPFVLVGHSLGGQNVRLFAHEFPDKVAGMILVDPSHERQSERMPESMKQADEQSLRMARIGRGFARLGCGRLFLPSPGADVTESEAIERALSLRTPHVLTMCEELLQVSIGDSQVQGCRLAPEIPLAVLSASRWEVGIPIPPEAEPAALSAWHALHGDLAMQSSNSFHIIVADSGHGMPKHQSKVVVDAIRAVVGAARNHTRLEVPPSLANEVSR